MSAIETLSEVARFDDRNINWRKLGDFEHFVYTIFNVDEANEIADLCLKFEPRERIFLHRHRALTHTFVLQGEHRLYEPNGALKESRAVGTYTMSPASPDPHKEGAGDEPCVVFYSTRGTTNGVLFDVLDDEANQVGQMTLTDLAGLFELQGRKSGA